MDASPERARTHINRLAEQSIYERDFWFGFVAGQAEKVWLGVCPAAMVRPDPLQRDNRLEHVRTVADEYGLSVTECGREIWIHQPRFAIGQWVDCCINSAEWHTLRAAACGIVDVDPHYHERL